MVFQKRSSRQDHKYKFYLDTVALEHSENDTYLGLNNSTTGNCHIAVNDLRDKAMPSKGTSNLTYQLGSGYKYLNQLYNPLPFMFVRSGFLSPIKNSLNGTNTKLRLCMQNSTKISSVYNVNTK